MGNGDEITQDHGEPRILLVDDERQFRQAMRKQLTVRGFFVFDADNGKDAVKIARRERPEVVVLDLKMPGMDGIQTLRKIKKIRPEAQVIMLTDFGVPETSFDGAFHCMRKPCGLEELVAAIEAARRERLNALSGPQMAKIQNGSLKCRILNAYNSQPGLAIAVLVAAAIVVLLALAMLFTGKP